MVCAQALRARGCNPDVNKLRGLKRTLREASDKSMANGTVQGYCTSVTKFIAFLRVLDLPLQDLVSEAQLPYKPTEVTEFHSELLFNYCAMVTVTQDRADTCKTYAKQVQAFFRKTYKCDLWTKPMLAELHPLVKGLTRLKNYVARWREGISGGDMVVIKETILRWARQGLRVQPGRPEVWDARLAASVIGSFEFAYGETFRYGEATCPDGEVFDPILRLSREHAKIHAGASDQPDVMVMRAPGYKVINKFQGVELTDQILPGDAVNWPTAVQHLMSVDKVRPEDAGDTPMFRDTRRIRRRRDGFFEGGGHPLKPRFIREVIRRVVTANQDWFGSRLPAHFGVHSFRIGSMNDLLDAGADYFEVSTLGRWSSASVMDYHRMARDRQHSWKRRALHTSLATADRTRTGADIGARAQRLAKFVQKHAASDIVSHHESPKARRSSTQTSITQWTQRIRSQ